jgi:hypothetical protein
MIREIAQRLPLKIATIITISMITTINSRPRHRTPSHLANKSSLHGSDFVYRQLIRRAFSKWFW